MPDVRLCRAVDDEGNVCRVAHECHRNTATQSHAQAYGPPGLGFDPKDGCEDYLPNKWEPSHA